MTDLIRQSSDWHVHSEKPEMTPAAVAEMAHRLGLHSIGITDHVFRDDNRLKSRAAIIERFGRISGVKIYYGAEVDVYAPGKVAEIPEEYLPADYVLLSFTHLRPGYSACEFKDDVRRLAAEIYQLFLTATARKGVFGIAHPFAVEGPSGINEALMAALTDDDLIRGIDNANRNGIAFELNTARIRRSPDAQMRFLKLCRARNARFFIGSDAHYPADFEALKTLTRITDQLNLDRSDLVAPDRPDTGKLTTN